MSEVTPAEITAWYRNNSSSFNALADSVKATIVSLLKAQNVDYVTISSRVKTLQSVLEKITRKHYSSTNEITDMLGVRVILYLESDIQLVNDIVEEAFEIDASHSVNKSDELAVDQMGYRSTHHICGLGSERLKLPELKEYAGLNFEIQVRTLLQHAWAEIEHDRSYKFPGDLPKEYRRRLNLISGTLELIDREFSTLVKDLDEYNRNKLDNPSGLAMDGEITSHSVKELINSLDQLNVKLIGDYPITDINKELQSFGLKNIGDVNNIITGDFVQEVNKHNYTTTSVGFLRTVMMFADVDRYMSKSWTDSWQVIGPDTHAILSEKYEDDTLFALWSNYDIDIADE